MGENADPVYGGLANNGVLFSWATTIVVAGLRTPLPRRGDGVLQLARWVSGNATPERRSFISKDSRCVRAWRRLLRGPEDVDEERARQLPTAIARDLGVEPWRILPAVQELFEAILRREHPPGAWVNIIFALSAVREHGPPLAPAAANYLEFIKAHLELERSLLGRLAHGEAARDAVTREAHVWLDLEDPVDDDNPGRLPGVARLLYWLALIDLGLHVTARDDGPDALLDEGHSSLTRFLPRLEDGEYVGGVQRLLRYAQGIIAAQHGKPIDGERASRQTMCRTMERLLAEAASDNAPRGTVPPAVPKRWRANAIDERLGRYVSGQEHFGVYEGHALFGGNGPPLTLQTLGWALIGQLDDFTRMFGKQSDIPPARFVNAYARYPSVFAMIERRYARFQGGAG